MKKITLVELSSGFGNVSNDVILESEYSRALQERTNSGSDVYHTVELPDGFRIGETVFGEHFIVDADGVEWEPFVRGKGSSLTRKASIYIQKFGSLESITLPHV